ncbi:MAG: glyoxalase superfamily protein [Agitococcus sp.]|nr:glyoxalase superfamily protein [Agitococcus sp.]MDO9177160.1 glyoxalase superfamily protein [Agitococcus sp.]
MKRTPTFTTQTKLIADAFATAGTTMGHQQTLELVAQLQGYRDYNTYLAEQKRPKKQESKFNGFKESFEFSWTIYEVLEKRPDLCKQEAFEVLFYTKRRYDANNGVSWQTIEDNADECFSLRTFAGELRICPDIVATQNMGEVAVLKGTFQINCELDISFSPDEGIERTSAFAKVDFDNIKNCDVRFVGAQVPELDDGWFGVWCNTLGLIEEEDEDLDRVRGVLRDVIENLEEKHLLEDVALDA